MKGYLRLRIRDDDDGLVELVAEFATHGFAGNGSAYIVLANLAEQAEKFAEYPLRSNQLVKLEGGYWDKETPSKLNEEHLHISIFPTNLRGDLVLLIRVGIPKDDSPGLRYSAAAELRTNYEDLAQFSKNLVSLANGEISEVLFFEAE
jgi:hypothetical protein